LKRVFNINRERDKEKHRFQTIALFFQTKTKYLRNTILGNHLNWAEKPEIYKSYQTSKTIQLLRQVEESTATIGEVIHKRRSKLKLCL